MTTQDYINEEIRKDREAAMRDLAQQQQVYFQQHPAQTYTQIYGNPRPSEVILLRAKVRELTDQLAAERGRCAKIARECTERPDEWDVPRLIARRIMGEV